MHAETDWKSQLQALHRESWLWSLNCCRYDEEMARDVLQSVYLKIYDGKAFYRQKSSLKTWLFSVIRFTSIDVFRKRGLDTEALNEMHGQIPEPESDPGAERQELFMNILNSLSVQQREVLTLAFYHDLTLEEIALLLGISIGSVRTHYARGKEKMKKLIIRYKMDNDYL